MGRSKTRDRSTSFSANYRYIVKNKIAVTGTKYDKEVSEIIEDPEQYRQCYKKGFKALEQLPKYWYVSREGYLISVQYKDKPQFIQPNLDSERPQWIVSNTKKGLRKNLTTYQLTALVYGSEMLEEARELLEKRGIKVLGKDTRDKKTQRVREAVQVHHKGEGYIKEPGLENYIKNNDPDKLLITSNKPHKILSSIVNSKNFTEAYKTINKIDGYYPESAKTYAYDIDGNNIIEDVKRLDIKAITDMALTVDGVTVFRISVGDYIVATRNPELYSDPILVDKLLEELEIMELPTGVRLPVSFRATKKGRNSFVIEEMAYIEKGDHVGAVRE